MAKGRGSRTWGAGVWGRGGGEGYCSSLRWRMGRAQDELGSGAENGPQGWALFRCSQSASLFGMRSGGPGPDPLLV